MNKLTIFLGTLLGLTLVACGATPTPGGGGSNPENAPVINSFKAADTTVASGGSTTLTWDVTGATSLKLAADVGPSIGEVTGSSLVVTPLQTTVYTLTASNADGASTDKTTVSVGQVPTQSITELVKADEQFSMLERVLDETGLAATLAGDGPYTLFAPNDAAFAYLLDTNLQISFEDFLKQPGLEERFKFHILKGRVLVDELEEGKAFVTLQDYPVTTELSENGDLRVEAATVIETDIPATNGAVYLIDEVLQPPAKGTVEYTLDATLAEDTKIFGTARFTELSPTQTEIVLELTGVTAGMTLPAHVHEGDVGSNGAIKYPLANVDGATGKSATTLDVAYGTLLEFDGYLNVHLSEAQPDIVVATGEVGAGVVPPDLGRRAKATR